MIGTLLRVSWTSLSRDRVAQAMTFLLPIAFFSLFALIFGSQGRTATARVRLAVVDQDRSEISHRLIRALEAEQGLRVITAARLRGAAKDAPRVLLDRARAESMVRDGDVPAALVIPAGLDSSFGRFDQGGSAFELLCDPSDPVAPQMAAGLLQRAAMTAAPDLMAKRGMDVFERYAGSFTPQQRKAVDAWLPYLRARATGSADSAAGDTAGPPGGAGAFGGLVQVKTTNLLGERREGGMVSFYAAGIAIMFLLFSCVAGSGVLLEEIESGTLDRVLTSNVGMTGLLAGKWLYLLLLGMLQITVMFLWGMLAFRLDLLRHLPGFVVMTVVTAAVASAFGLVLATACRTRAQLSGIATILILCLSAVGGSMFPRFLMSDTMQRLGLVAFNAWALDGYVKVFWRDARLLDLAPQVGVLLAFTGVFLVVARLLARRWESA